MLIILDSMIIKKALDIIKIAKTKQKILLPIIENIYIDVKPEQIEFKLTNLEIEANCIININTEISGVILVNYNDFSKFINLCDGNVTIQVEDNVCILINNFNEYTIANYTSYDEFPNNKEIDDDVNSINITNFSSIYKMLSKASKIVSSDELRIIMTHILMRIYANKNTINIVATDAHRLIRGNIIVENLNHNEDVDILVNPSLIASFKNIEEVKIYYNEGIIMYSYVIGIYNINIKARRLNGRYPNYEAVIPNECLYSVSFRVEDFIKSIELINLTNSLNNQMILSIDKQCNLTSINLDFGKKIISNINAIENKSDKLEIGFNSIFFNTIINLLEEDDFELRIISNQKAVIIKENDSLFLLMPVMI